MYGNVLQDLGGASIPLSCSFHDHGNESDALSAAGIRRVQVLFFVTSIGGSSCPRLLASKGNGLLPLGRRNSEVKGSGRTSQCWQVDVSRPTPSRARIIGGL